MVGVEAIGIASSITAFVDILSIIIIFDMSLGMKRPLGISVSSGNYGRFKQVLGTTVILVSSSVIISTVLLLLPSLNLLGKIGFRDTPMFPLEVLWVKRTQRKVKKYLQKVCLKTWIIIIKIPKDHLPLRV